MSYKISNNLDIIIMIKISNFKWKINVNFSFGNVRVIVGAWNLEERNTEYKIKKYFVADFNSRNMVNDIALVRLQNHPVKNGPPKSKDFTCNVLIIQF